MKGNFLVNCILILSLLCLTINCEHSNKIKKITDEIPKSESKAIVKECNLKIEKKVELKVSRAIDESLEYISRSLGFHTQIYNCFEKRETKDVYVYIGFTLTEGEQILYYQETDKIFNTDIKGTVVFKIPIKSLRIEDVELLSDNSHNCEQNFVHFQAKYGNHDFEYCSYDKNDELKFNGANNSTSFLVHSKEEGNRVVEHLRRIISVYNH